MEQDLAHAETNDDICECLALLAGSRWETHVLLRLAEAPKPLRRITVKIAIMRVAGVPIPGNTLDRILGRLTTQELVRWSLDEELHKVYVLTEAGRQRATQLAQLLEVLCAAH